MNSGQKLLNAIEDYCGERVTGTRLRVLIASRLNTLVHTHNKMKRDIQGVVAGEFDTYSPDYEKPIKLNAKELERVARRGGS